MPALHLYPIASQIEVVEGKKLGKTVVRKDYIGKLDKKYKWEVVWRNVIFFIILHLLSVYAIYVCVTEWRWELLVFAYVYGILVAYGVTAGAHRLWAHRAYKAKLPLKLILLFLQTSAFQNSVYVWVRDHRAHHKFTDTDADPHNSSRGFFFSHVGWLLVKKQKEVTEKGKTIDMSDIRSDKYLMFQHRYYAPLMIVCCFIIPTLIPCYLWNENYWMSFLTGGIFRYALSVHCTWLVNSAAHIYGMRPYDKNIKPTENKIVSYFACGEGFHNYHHTFPWDYKASELGGYGLNWTLAVLNFFGKIGWAYDMKTVSEEMVRKRVARTGDLQAQNKINHGSSVLIWGWGDESMSSDDKECVNIINKCD